MPETNARIKVCHDTAANFKTNNPTLLVGEWALETDTKKMKIGDGSTAYNALPYSTAEDSDEWRKPDDWVDIRSGALPNSVYFLVAHSAPTGTAGSYTVDSYPQFGLHTVVSNNGTYDVYIDGIKVATNESNTDILLDWATFYNNGTLVGGFDVTYPSNFTTHVVRITPSNSNNIINQLYSGRILSEGTTINKNRGALWVHFNISNEIKTEQLFSSVGGYFNYPIMEAVTSANGKIKLSNMTYISPGPACKTFPTVVCPDSGIQFDNGFVNTKLKKIKIENLNQNTSARASQTFCWNALLQEIDTGNSPVMVGNISFENCLMLKKLPPLKFASTQGYSSNKNLNKFLSRCSSLEPTYLDASTGTGLQRLVIGGSSSYPITGIKGLTVSNEAPFDNATSPQLDVSYTGLSRAALVNLFKSMPYNVGYTVVGSPTIVDGVASGFSSSDYLKTTQDFPQSSNPFEMVFKVKFTAVNTTQVLFISNQNLIVAVSGQGHFRLQAQYQNSAWTYSQDGVYSVPVNTDLYIKVLYDGAVFKLSYSTNGISFTDDITISTSTLSFQSGYCLMGTRGNQPLLGYMDLNSTYIKVNGVTWFNGAATRQLDPAATNVGGVTITNGVASGFSTSKYIQTPESTITPGGEWEIGTRFLYVNDSRTNQTIHCFNNTGMRLTIVGGHNQLVYAYVTGDKEHIVSVADPNTLSDNRMYFVKIQKTTTDFITSISEDGVNWKTKTTAIEDTGAFRTANKLVFGVMSSTIGGSISSALTSGSIDLNNTYVKVGSDYVYRGMVPQVKTVSVVGCTGTADLTADDKAIATGKGWELTVA